MTIYIKSNAFSNRRMYAITTKGAFQQLNMVVGFVVCRSAAFVLKAELSKSLYVLPCAPSFLL